MRSVLIIVTALQVMIVSASGQSAPQSATAKADLLSADQKVKIGELVTKNTPALTNIQFSPIIDQAVPPQIQIQALPPGAEQMAPQLHGYGCVVFEELIAIVDQNTRKVAIVIPLWRQQDKRG
jgi:hypothetical protein